MGSMSCSKIHTALMPKLSESLEPNTLQDVSMKEILRKYKTIIINSDFKKKKKKRNTSVCYSMLIHLKCGS